MARHFRRRLIYGFLAGIAALAVLALLALAALWWFLDPDDYRAQIESRAGAAIGRQVRLTGALSWQLGRRIYIVSEGGEIANAAGFGPTPLARWSRIRLGVEARPLLDRRVVIDHIDVHGLQLDLQRDAQARVNWVLQGSGGGSAADDVSVLISGVALHGSTVRYRDAGTGADWIVTALEASAKLPDDFMAPSREFGDVSMSGRISGGDLAAGGVAFEFQAPALQLSPQRMQVAAFAARWAEARLDGEVDLRLDQPGVVAKLKLQAPSLRALLATAGVEPPPMRDASTLGAVQLGLALRYVAGTVTVDDLFLKLDDTELAGRIELPRLDPIAIRFTLAADRVDLDRYREPSELQSKPLELPLAWLKQLDAKGSLSIEQAVIEGAAAKKVRIDVE